MVKVKLIEIDKVPRLNYKKQSQKTIEEILKPFDASFSIENVSRAKTHEICESNDSYTQQSMRYVKMGKDAFIIPPVFSNPLKKEFSETMFFLLQNYEKLSEIKDKFKGDTGRPKSDWFKYAPIEDNRYGLSLATPSNILVTMDVGKMLNFFGSMSKDFETEKIFQELSQYLPSDLAELCYEQIGTKDFSLIEETHRNKLDSALESTFVNMKSERFERAGLGALTSTNSQAPSEIEYSGDKLINVAKRVVGYGHESIIEHSKSGCGLGMSLVTYHQFERHRLPANVRENFSNLPNGREIIIPPKIQANEEAKEIFDSSIDASRELRAKIMNDSPEYNHFALLNGAKIGVYSNMNARTFYHLANERLCNNAQWEIQGLLERVALNLRSEESNLYEKCAPKCITQNGCPEGKLTCGTYKKVKEKYGQ